MIIGIMCGGLLEKVIADRSWKTLGKVFVFLIINILFIGLAGYSIGLFGGINAVQANSIGGYGFFSMNLNALINPISHSYGCFGAGNSKWSLVMPVREQILGNYDGFNYLGLGVIGSLVIIALVLCFQKDVRKSCFDKIKENYGLLIVLIGLFLYALSNVMTFDDKILFSYEMPSVLYPILSTFKASSRYFYPVLYMIYIFIIYFGKIMDEKKKCIILAVVIIVQMVDFSSVLIEKRLMFTEERILQTYEARKSGLEEWEVASNGYNTALLLDPVADPAVMYDITYAAGKTNTKNNFNIMNRGDIGNLKKSTDFYVQDTLLKGELNADEMYLFSNEQYAELFAKCLSVSAEIKTVKQNANEFYQVVRSKEESSPDIEEKVVLEELQETTDGMIVVDILEEENSYKLTGWAFIRDNNVDEQQQFLVIQTKRGENILLPLRGQNRADVAEVFGEEYGNSAFEIYLQGELKENAEKIYLIVTNKEQKMISAVEALLN